MAFNMWRDYLGLNATLRAIMASSQVTADSSHWEDTGDPTSTSQEASLIVTGSAPWERESRPQRCPQSPQALAPQDCQPDTLKKNPEFAHCSFCKHNGEAPSFFSTHSLKDSTGKVVCPVLRSYVCPQCGATGDKAHTRRFCPLTKDTYTSVYQSTFRKADTKKTK